MGIESGFAFPINRELLKVFQDVSTVNLIKSRRIGLDRK